MLGESNNKQGSKPRIKQLDSAGVREMLGCTDLVQEKAAGSVWWHRVPEGGCECKAIV